MPKFKGLLEINGDKCKGCGLCVSVCPVDILYLDGNHVNKKGYHVVSINDLDKCIACANCALICPDVVIGVRREERGVNHG